MRQPIVQVAPVVGAGVLVEAGCLWTWYESPRLTAIYNADYTRAVLSTLPGLKGLVDDGPSSEPAEMAARLLAGLFVMVAGYVLALSCRRHVTWIAVAGAVLFRATLALMPGLYSTDVFSYVMYGRIAVGYAANPYIQPPAAFPDDAFLIWVFPFWRDQPTVYGPLWTDLSWVLSRLTLDWSPLGQVLAYRTLGLALEVATLGVLWWLLERLRTPDRTRAWLVYAWNPLILFDLVGGGHNDVAMLALLLVGIAISTGGAALAGIGMLALSALVKYASALVVLLAATAWSARGDSRSARVRRMTLGLGVALLLGIAFWAPWLTSRDAWLVLGDAAGGKLVLNSAPDVIALWIADHASVEPDLARLWVRWTTRLVFAAFFCGELWRVWRSRGDTVHLVKACTRAMLLVPLLVLTWVWSWYFSWSLVLAVVVGWDWRGTRLVVAYTIVALPIVYAHQYLNDQFPAGWILVMALVPLLVLVPIRRGGAARTFSKRGGGTMQ